MKDFSKIVLTYEERFRLFTLIFVKKQCGDVHSAKLCRLFQYGLICPNYSSECDKFGQYLPDGTYSLSDSGKRYRIFLRRERFHRYLTPVTVSVITTTLLYISERWLLPELLNWLLDHF